MINFMLPVQFGAMTIDGTWLILLGIIAVAGIIYKNRNNISLTSTDSVINENDNVNSNIELEDNTFQINASNENIKSNEANVNEVKESVEEFNQQIEKEKVFN